MLIQQPGAATYDTRAELTERPGSFLSGAFTLWHPESNFGEFQNQAYGYLFPQGAWFVLTDAIGTPGWVSQRLWSALILIVACEGARRVARAIGLSNLPALLAGVVFAFSPRLLGTVAVQTGESLPGAVMPWLVLAVLLHLQGRLSAPRTAVLSGAAVVCMGGVNAVENGGVPAAGDDPRRLGRDAGSSPACGSRSAGSRRWAPAACGGRCPCWCSPATRRRSTSTSRARRTRPRSSAGPKRLGATPRGSPTWSRGTSRGGRRHFTSRPTRSWSRSRPSSAALGLAGLALLDSAVKRPLMLAVVLGLGCLTVAHGGPAGAPAADVVRDLLDGALQIFRNVHKIDPMVRLPLAIGFGCAVARGAQLLVERAPRLRTGGAPAAARAAAGGPGPRPPLPAGATPGRRAGTSSRRTGSRPGPTWPSTRPAAPTAAGRWSSPGSRFAQHEWGWTLDEPLAILGDAPMVSRSQVPLIPGESIRYLSALDQLIATGRATEALAGELARAGITHVVLRRDLLRGLTGSPHPGAARGLAGARRSGAGGRVRRAAPTERPQVEVFEVPDRLPLLRATPVDDVVTVRGAAESVLAVEGGGLVGAVTCRRCSRESRAGTARRPS